MKSTFQSLKKRFYGSSSSKPEKDKRKIVHPHLREESGNNVTTNDNYESTASKSTKKGLLATRGERSKDYEAKSENTKNEDAFTPTEENGSHNPQEEKPKRPNKLSGFFRRSVYGMRFSAIDDTRGNVEKEKEKIVRPKSIHAINSSSLSVLSPVRKSVHLQSKQSEETVTVATSPRHSTQTPDNLSQNVSDSLEYSSADISSTKSSVKDEPDGAKSMSIGSDVNQSERDLKTNGTDVDLNMNDIAVNVSRLSNKAAYDKIALRPKRRPARNARGAQQQHVVRVQAQINGFAEAESPTRDEDFGTDTTRDTSPPRAKKARPPSFLPQIQDAEKRNSGEGPTTTPKRFSMLGRSPVGPGPGMVVPSLEDVQKIKLRKRQPNGEGKDVEMPPEKPSAVKSKAVTKSAPEKAEKSKTTKKSSSSRKTPKDEQKGGSESGSSFFSWKNKSSSPKTPAVKQSDSAKENEKPKTVFPPLKPAKKTAPDKETKVSAASRFFSNSEKKEAAKKKGVELGKRDKNHSGNNSKEADEAAMDVVAEPPPSQAERMFPENERAVDNFPKNERDSAKDQKSSLLEQMTAEWSQRESKLSCGKRESGGSKYAEKVELEAEMSTENRVQEKGGPMSLKSPSDSKKYVIEDKKLAETKSDGEYGESAKVKDESKTGVKVSEKMKNKEVNAVSPIEEKHRPASLNVSTDRSTSPSALLADEKSKVVPLDVSKERSTSPSSAPVVEKSTVQPAETGNVDQKPKATHMPAVVVNRSKSPETDGYRSVGKNVTPSASKSIGETIPVRSTTQKEDVKLTDPTTVKRKPIVLSTVKDDVPLLVASKEKLPLSPAKVKPSHTPNLNVGMPDNKTPAPSEEKGAKLDALKKSRSLEHEDTPTSGDVQDKKDVTQPPDHRFRSASAREASKDGPVEVYSRNKLKPIGDSFTNRRSTSVKINSPVTSPSKTSRPRSFNVRSAQVNIESAFQRDEVKPGNSPVTSPSRALRPRSFNVKSAQGHLESAAPKDDNKSEKSPVKAKFSVPSPKPSPVKEKPKVAEKPKSPVKTPIRTPNIKTLMQDAENNNVKTPDADKKSTAAVEQASPIRRNPKPSKEKDDSAPVWVQMARRRSKVWEEGGLKSQKALTQRTPSTEETTKKDDRPQTLPIVTKPRPESREKTPTPATTPIKSSPRTPSSKTQANRTASIPNISMISPRKSNPTPKEVTTGGRPSWMAIAMQKQKSWAKEETV